MEHLMSVEPIRETKDLLIYKTILDGKKVFVKQAKTEGGDVFNKREFYNQEFLRNITQNQVAGFEFLEPSLNGRSLIYPDISEQVKWLAAELGSETPITPLPEYSNEMIKFLKFCLQIPYDKIPEEIRIDSAKRLENVPKNFLIDANYLLDNQIISQAQLETMKSCIEKAADPNNQAFQHHDVVPWHMAQDKSDGKLILVDANWAGWSLKYYDVAYYILQMIGYAERTAEAQDFLNIIKKELAEDRQLKETLAIPLSYRGVRLAAELHRKQKVKNAQEVMGLVLSEI